MPLSVQCPTCNAKLNAPDSAAGKRLKCPKCQTSVAVPGQATAAVGKSPAAPVAATTAPKVAALPPMPAPRPAKAAVTKAGPKPEQPTPPPAVEIAPAFPAVTTVPKPAAKAKAGVGTVLVILAAVAGGGLLICMGGIAAVVMFFLSSDEPAPAAPNRAVAAAGPAMPAELPRGQPAAPVRPTPTPASSINWVAYEDSGKGFKAVFPGGKPQPLDPLESVKDPEQRELALAFMKDWTVLGVTHDGRKYTLTAAPLDLGGMPASVYLERMAGGLSAIHDGFSLDQQPQADKSAPLRDYVLKKDDAGKLLRVVVAGGHVYQLLIEGEASLAFSDPAAKEYFEKFEAGGVSAPAVASADSNRPKSKTKSKTKRRPSEPPPEEVANNEPENVEWQTMTSDRFAYTVNFPVAVGRVENPYSLLVPENRQIHFDHWKRDGISVESRALQLGDRRYGVTALHHPNPRGEGSIRFAAEMKSLVQSFAQDLYNDVQDRGVSQQKPSSKLERAFTTAMIMQDSRKAIVRQAYAGNYGFVLRVEGPATMDDLDPLVHQFLDSLEPPPDPAVAPLPIGSPRKGKTKK